MRPQPVRALRLRPDDHQAPVGGTRARRTKPACSSRSRIEGTHLKGRAQNADAHQRGFDHFFVRGSRLVTERATLRFIADDVVHVVGGAPLRWQKRLPPGRRGILTRGQAPGLLAVHRVPEHAHPAAHAVADAAAEVGPQK